MIVDLMQATQDAVFASLKQGADLTLSDVFQHMPQGTQPPWRRIGAIDSDNEAGKGEQYEVFTVEIQGLFRGSARSPLIAMMHDARKALDEVPLVAAGVIFGEPRFLKASISDPGPDGQTYAAVSYFEISAEPA